MTMTMTMTFQNINMPPPCNCFIWALCHLNMLRFSNDTSPFTNWSISGISLWLNDMQLPPFKQWSQIVMLISFRYLESLVCNSRSGSSNSNIGLPIVSANLIFGYPSAKMLNGWHEAVYSPYETFEKSQEDKFLKPSKFQKFQQC